MTKQEWIDVILDKWVADEPVGYAYAITSLYSSQSYETVSEVMTEVLLQQGDMIINDFIEEHEIDIELEDL